MQNKLQIIGGVIILAIIVIVGIFIYRTGPVPTSSVNNADDTAVRAFVTAFGGTLKNVSLLASNKSQELADNYGPYVSPELLKKWQDGTESAPGRQTSSPWPERIDVTSVTPSGAETYTVEGNVIEVTSADTLQSLTATYPITMTVQKKGDSFVITALSMGAYAGASQTISVEGTWECLPHKDTSGPQTMECAFGIAKAQSDAHYAINTSLMQGYPADFPTGTKVRVEGTLTPASGNQASIYDIDGTINATSITKI